MTNAELVNQLEKIQELYPRFKVSELVVQYWHKSFISYSVQEFDRAFDRHVEASSHAPTIAEIKTHLTQIFGKRNRGRPQAYPIPYTKLDFCMDMLGARFVSDELKLLAGVYGGARWSDVMKLASRKDGWGAKYQAIIEKIYGYAVGQWNEGVRPQTKWLGSPYACPYDMQELPAEFESNKNFEVRYVA